jgi:hypothetical protein
MEDAMLTNFDIWELAKRMRITNLVFVGFKNELPKLKPNTSYIINMDDSEDESTGKSSKGTHWVGLQITQPPKGQIQVLYFDSFGVAPPKSVQAAVKNDLGVDPLPYTTKNIQSVMAYACGWYVLAWLHYVNVFNRRRGCLYGDTEDFLDCFDDLQESMDFKKNEFVLKLFFQAEDSALRKPVSLFRDTDVITGGDEDALNVEAL